MKIIKFSESAIYLSSREIPLDELNIDEYVYEVERSWDEDEIDLIWPFLDSEEWDELVKKIEGLEK